MSLDAPVLVAPNNDGGKGMISGKADCTPRTVGGHVFGAPAQHYLWPSSPIDAAEIVSSKCKLIWFMLEMAT